MPQDSGRPVDATILDRLYKVVESRKGANPDRSNTARLFAKGTEKIAQKLGEEAIETVIEGVRGKKRELAAESADLLYHRICSCILFQLFRLNELAFVVVCGGPLAVLGVVEKQSRSRCRKSRPRADRDRASVFPECIMDSQWVRRPISHSLERSSSLNCGQAPRR